MMVFGFDEDKDDCVEYEYGGCFGTDNMFTNYDECIASCPPSDHTNVPDPKPVDPVNPEGRQSSGDMSAMCMQDRIKGPCRAVMMKFGYDQVTKNCVEYLYGGCSGSDNMFDSYEECAVSCPPAIAADPDDGNVTIPVFCLQPESPGPCDENIMRFAYSQEERKCVSFTYGGCGGNSNNFLTHDMCSMKCIPDSSMATSEERPDVPPPPKDEVDLCDLPQVVGECDDGSTGSARYYYNSNTGVCEIFFYSGCNGNRNRFMDSQACIERCVMRPELDDVPDERAGQGRIAEDSPVIVDSLTVEDKVDPAEARRICNLPFSAGYCDDSIDKFYYHSRLGECRSFRYRGCGGNENQFSNLRECQKMCQPAEEPDEMNDGEEDKMSEEEELSEEDAVCRLPPDQGGPCVSEGFVTKYHFVYNYSNPSLSSCEPFQYRGCGGNRNNFDNVEICESVCG